jgi:peroxiredoxin
MVNAETVTELLQEMQTNQGNDLYSLSNERPVLLVFLRHFGCTFCREALADLAKKRESIQAAGSELVFVHMSHPPIADRYFSRFNLEGIQHISDPECDYYEAFGLTKGKFTQLFGLQVWLRGFSAGVVQGHGIGRELGDGFQMPGVFVIQDGQIKESFIHKLASDRPDYEQLVQCCSV